MEVASRQTASPDQGLTVVGLTPTRSGKSSNAGISSSNASMADSDDHNGLLDKLKLDKLKIGRRGSVDDRRKSSDTGRRLSRLIGSRRRHKKDSGNADEHHNDDEDSLRSGVDQKDNIIGMNTSAGLEDTLSPPSGRLDRKDSIASSLLTEDSDTEAAPRPALDTRESHAGFFTLSSPLIATESLNRSNKPAPVSISPKHTSQVTLQAFPDSSEATVLPNTIESVAVAEITTPPAIAVQESTEATSPRGRPQAIAITPPSTETPATFVTPPTPVLASPATASPASVNATNARKPVGTSKLSISSLSSSPQSATVRRLKTASGVPGGIINPLTPAIEEAKTPGGSLVQPTGAGFFSSVFSATQNAVNSISSSIDKSLGTRSRSGTGADERSGTSAPEASVSAPSVASNRTSDETPPREPAIATIGSGNLSLSHLGIPDVDGEGGTGSSTPNRARASSILQDNYMPSKTEEASAAQAVSAAYTEKPTLDRHSSATSDVPRSSSRRPRPRSIASAIISTPGDITPPGSVQNGDEGGLKQRSGSVRSRLSARRRRRESSNVTGAGGALAAALSSSHAAIANPAKSGRPAGFAVASTKRNHDFHNLFRSVPEDDYLIEDYSAALQRDILLQGRLYVSEKHVCFASNILGWTTNLVIGFDEIVATEKKNTAVVFPNAIVIQTLHAKNVFASFISRDSTYDLLINIWKIGHPHLKTTEHGHALDNTSPSEENAGNDESNDASEEGSGEYYDENEDDDASYIDADTIDAHSDAGDLSRAVSVRSPSGTASIAIPANGALKPDTAGSASPIDFPGPLTHPATECTDRASHYEKLLMDTTIPAPLGKVYSMNFGPQSGVVMRKFLIDDQKSGDVQYEDDKRGMDKDHKMFSYSYIKYLNASIGPKQTKCLVTQTLDAFDLEKAVSVTCSTVTPDVPSGNVFTTKTKYCLMWGPNNTTRFIANCTIEWSGKSWLKGPIEKGANDGQEKYAKDIVAFFKAQLLAKSPSKITKGKPKRRKRGETESEEPGLASTVGNKAAEPKAQAKANWGPLEPLHDLLGPAADMINTNVILGVLLFLMTILWLRQSYSSGQRAHAGPSVMMTPQRLAAYEELWRREESGLWNWLEDRVGLESLGTDVPQAQARHMLATNKMASKLEIERMSEREVDEAVRVTEEKLLALKAAIDRKKGAKEAKGKA